MVVKSDQDTIKSYFEDSSNLSGGHAQSVYIPETTEELSKIVGDANAQKTPMTISGGGTATTGSRVPFGGIILSTERLSKIIDISSQDMSAVVQAGCRVEDLKSLAESKGLFYTCHPTEKLATIGGTVSTNASGARSYKYGPTRKYVRRLRMILASGEIFDLRRGEILLKSRSSVIRTPSGRKLRIDLPDYKMPETKNASGYYAREGMDLIDLFIGQEGTLSVVAEIEMGLVKKPAAIFSAFFFFPSEEDSWRFVQDVKSGFLPGILSIEYFGSNALNLLRKKNSNVPQHSNAAIFIEQECVSSTENSTIDRWNELIARHNGSLDDTWVAMNEKEGEAFNDLRHSIPESVNEIVKASGFRKFSTDMAVPSDKLLEMMRFYGDEFSKSGLEHVIFGHIGENHLHVNALPHSADEVRKAEDLTLRLIRKGVSAGGTVSAEHGIGKLKHKYLEELYGKAGVLQMARLKKELDPNCILGLDNIFPRELLKLV